MAKYNITSFGLSDTGQVRGHNEDRYKALADLNFFVVADGMGGHQGGAIAAQEAVDRLCDLFRKVVETEGVANKSAGEMSHMIGRLFEDVNRHVFELGCAKDKLQGMGTTLSCVWLNGEDVVYANVGDSRIYRHRRGSLEQLTRDDSLLRDLLDLGQLEDADADDFLYRNVITKSIGMGPELMPAVDRDVLLPQDLFLLCSDGLSNMVSHQEMEDLLNRLIVEEEATVKAGVEALVDLANKKGGEDNITVLLVKVDE